MQKSPDVKIVKAGKSSLKTNARVRGRATTSPRIDLALTTPAAALDARHGRTADAGRPRDLELRRFGIGAQRGLDRGPAFGRQPLVAFRIPAARQLD
jgi:hypothetical protein